MRVKALIEFKGKFDLTYIGRTDKQGKFRFRNKQLRKACLKRLKDVFTYDCPGGSLAISTKIFDDYIICYNSVVPKKEDSKKYIITYYKRDYIK